MADYNEGVVDTKLPEAILDNVYKYRRRCIIQEPSIMLLFMAVVADRMKISIRQTV